MKPEKKKKPRWRSQRAHRDACGTKCPNRDCESDPTDLEYDKAEIDGDLALQSARCLVCGARWIDKYKLIGYNKTGDPE